MVDLFFSHRRPTQDPEKYRPLSMEGGHSDAVLALLSLPGEQNDTDDIRILERLCSNRRSSNTDVRECPTILYITKENVQYSNCPL